MHMHYTIPRELETIDPYQPIVVHIFTYIKEDLSPLDAIVVTLISY